jgi:membrane associated rhomboid family serine protease
VVPSSTSLIPIKDDNPTKSVPYVTIAIIVANVLIWLTEPGLGSGSSPQLAAFFYKWGLVPKEIVTGGVAVTRDTLLVCGGACKTDPPYYSIVTAMFLHGGFLHVAGNMLFLWVFGNNIEDTLGPVKFTVFYFVCGIAAALAHTLANANSLVPTVGASGAVAGMLGAYIVLFPRARVTTIVPVFIFWFVKLPAVIVLGYWFLSQFFIGAAQQYGGEGVAWMAHVGGFVTGGMLMYLYKQAKHLGEPPPYAPPPYPSW